MLDAHGQTVLWRAVQGDLHTIIDACLLQNIDLSQGELDKDTRHSELFVDFNNRLSCDTDWQRSGRIAS